MQKKGAGPESPAFLYLGGFTNGGGETLSQAQGSNHDEDVSHLYRADMHEAKWELAEADPRERDGGEHAKGPHRECAL